MESYTCESFWRFESRQEASDQLLEALINDDNCRIVGLYGEQGCGKTALAKDAGKQAKYLKIFDVVSFATVSQNPNIGMIQDEIARSLNLSLSTKSSPRARASTIYARLKYNERVLMILDDVWGKNIELEEIGIPCDDNRCKFLLTTRGPQECALMNCQRKIPLHPLSREEAWALFKEYSGINDEYSPDNILNMAFEVANECKGLPGIIKEVGSSLKHTPIEDLKASLSSHRRSLSPYQIFLSFRGTDTRNSFTGFLYDALCQGGFKTFIDDEGLHRGDQISSSLLNAIEASRLSIVVLSENYATSPWCLDELVMIIECMKMNIQSVLPIFYKVEPSDIRHLRNNYGKAMAEHETNSEIDPERIQSWRSALFEVSNLSGETYKTGYEHAFIRKIVEDVKRLHALSMDMH